MGSTLGIQIMIIILSHIYIMHFLLGWKLYAHAESSRGHSFLIRDKDISKWASHI